MFPYRKSVIGPLISFLAAAVMLLGVSGLQASSQTPRGWRTAVKDGVHWLVTPEGRFFYSKGVNIVASGKENEASRRLQSFFWGNFHPSLDAWRRVVGEQLAEWGFNTRGGWSDPSPDIMLPLTVDLELGRNSQFHWFDPFDPAMEAKTQRLAEELTAPYRNDPLLIGYFSDNEVGWWNSPLFLWYLKGPWENHTKQVLWNLLYTHYDGLWERLLADWVPEGSLSGFEDLKLAGAQLKLRPGGQGIYLVDRFMYLCAQRYYQLMSQAIRKAHPGALYLGDRLPLYYHQDAILAMGDSIDVISTNYNVDVPDGWIAPYFFEGLELLSGKPVLVTEFFFAATENRSGNRNETARNRYPKPGHLMTVATQAERAWGAGRAAVGFARFPNVVGAHWFQYCDEPLGGREDGEDYNMGLIDNANRPYEDVTEMFQRLNPVLDMHHRESGRLCFRADEGRSLSLGTAGAEGAHAVCPATRGPTHETVPGGPDTRLSMDEPVPIHRASLPIDVRDQSLLDWDKKRTRLKGFRIERPHVPFGDVHFAWNPRGLYFASLTNTFVNPGFLAYQGDFPLSECFQMHLDVETGGRFSRFSIHLVPRVNPSEPDGFEVVPRLSVQMEGRQIESPAPDGMLQRIHKALPHMVLEGFIPVEKLGLEELRAGTKLRMNVVVQSYYREMTMSWSGPTTLESAGNPENLREIVLVDSGDRRAALQ